jgi:pimeloyl-ACP methyl ester carboxylesterase
MPRIFEAAMAAFRFAGITACLAFASVLGASTPAAAAPPMSPAWRTPIIWSACPAGSAAGLSGFTCASVRAPLDYRFPTGPVIELAVVKHAATIPARRIGTLFVNPGGPAGQGTQQIPGWIDFFPNTLRERFDIVSWDPRGVGLSTAVACFESAAAEAKFLGANADFPVTPALQPSYIETWAQFGRRCAATEGNLLTHVSTADTARDLDLLRRAVGEQKLTYIGLSYGTFLGATYANLFPDKVRALVLDGNVAPSAWTATGPGGDSTSLTLRIGGDVVTAKTLNDLLALCGQVDPARCAFSAGSGPATQTKFQALLTRLEQGPITVGSGPTARTETYARLLDQLPDALLIVKPHPNARVPAQAIPGWSGLAVKLEELWQARGSASVTELSASAAGAPALASSPYAGPEQGLSIICVDSPSPPASAFPALARSVLMRDGPVGLGMLWSDEPCATWPARTDTGYAGPWNRWTAAPILVIGNTTDPSTPLSNAIVMVEQLARARLLVVHGFGHTALLNPSACATAATVAYLVDGVLPRPGTVCQQDAAPF